MANLEYGAYIYLSRNLNADAIGKLVEYLVEVAWSFRFASLQGMQKAFDVERQVTRQSGEPMSEASLNETLLAVVDGRRSEDDFWEELFESAPPIEYSLDYKMIRKATANDHADAKKFFLHGGTGGFKLLNIKKGTMGNRFEDTPLEIGIRIGARISEYPLHYVELCVRDEFICNDCLNEVNLVILELLKYCSESSIAGQCWTHLAPESAKLMLFGGEVLWEPMDEEYRENLFRFNRANDLGIELEFIRGVFWGNYWGKKFVERLGGLDAVKQEIRDLYSQKVFKDGSIFFSLTPDVMDLAKDDADIEKRFLQRKEKLVSFLAEYGVLLPSLDKLEKLGAEKYTKPNR